MEKEYFGVMLDMSRNAVMNVETLKEFILILKKIGYNSIELYTEDTYEIDGEPYFGYMRGRYSKEELKEINEYCNSVDIELIPCIQTLAHLNSIFHLSKYQDIRDIGDILLADNEKTYELIEKMFRSIRECFSSNIVNIGMDEAHMLGLGKYLEEHGYKNRFEILSKHLNRVIEIAKRYNFKPKMWSDMFFRLGNNGKYYSESPKLDEEVIKIVPKDVELIYWDYYHTDKDFYDKMIKAHKKFNNEIWFAGGAWSWIGFAPSNKYSINSTKPSMQACRENSIKNIFITLWGDNGKECSFFSLLPSLFYAIEVYKGNENLDSIKTKFKEKLGEDFDKFLSLDLPNAVERNIDGLSNICKWGLYSDVFSGFLDSTLTGDEKNKYLEYSKILRNNAKSSNYAYIFNYLSALCEVLYLKIDLGVETRNAYKNKDRSKLLSLIETYKKLIIKMNNFYKLFKKVWFKENKPYGFDVQEQRIGGLILRLKSCKDRLEDYLSGKIDKIEELDEYLLNYWCNGEEFDKRLPCYNSWKDNVSSCII